MYVDDLEVTRVDRARDLVACRPRAYPPHPFMLAIVIGRPVSAIVPRHVAILASTAGLGHISKVAPRRLFQWGFSLTMWLLIVPLFKLDYGV